VGTTVKTGIQIMSVTQHTAPAVSSAKISKFSATSLLKPGALASVHASSLPIPLPCLCSSKRGNHANAKTFELLCSVQHVGSKDWGLVAAQNIPAGCFVIEYIGTVPSQRGTMCCHCLIFPAQPAYCIAILSS
jgi:hypothetical protein